ncbi:MAG: ScaI family restriction endonuclease [Dehalococcoidia bacterium]|nr:MAG: ScaI family restriction endonuclease [Dehalococcoidia bacterium]
MSHDSGVLSPYAGLTPDLWEAKTQELVQAHPLSPDEIVGITLGIWASIFTSDIGSKPFRIGKHIFPTPQIMAFFLHELIPLELENRYPGTWRRGDAASEKDLVYVPDEFYCTEIKASSSTGQIYGNRSYAQKGSSSKKSKAGYYLAINFEKFSRSSGVPKITKIRFGWLDHSDWIGQRAATGQQARLSQPADRFKLMVLL